METETKSEATVPRHGMTPKAENWVRSEYGLPDDGSPVLVWDKHNSGMLFWSAETKEKMHADFKRLGFSHWRHLNPPDC